MDGWNSSYYVDPWPSEYCVIGRFNIKDAELCDDIVWIHPNWKLDCVGTLGFASIEPIEDQLSLRDDHFLGQLGGVLHLV